MTSSSNPFARPQLSDTHRLFLESTFAHNRARFGGFRMEDEPDADKDKGGKDDDADKDKGKPVDQGKTFSSDDVSRIVEERLGERDRKHKRELEQAQSDAGKSDTQRVEAERDRAVQAKDAAVQKAAPKVAQALAQVAAIAAGGRADRAAAIVRVADLEGVVSFDGDDWTVDEAKIGERLAKVLEDYPEWKGEAKPDDKPDDKGGDDGKPKGGKSGTDLGGNGGGAVDLDTFKRMNMKARSDLHASDPETYRRLADAEIAERSTPR